MEEFAPTATNMVMVVGSIIRGYGMGAIRALAQEPVQNAKDAARGNAHIEYRLYKQCAGNGLDVYMLTVTDSNTSGLQGPILSFADIQARGNILERDENWAAFEGMGYTKRNEDALGSRGQGKAAFLYHSNLPRIDSPHQERMMMLYDTLLSDGEYRLGVRYARPFDTVRRQPFYGEEAREIIASSYAAQDGTGVLLGLEPLTQVGTRVIVPHLSDEAVAAFQSGELYQWLQRCWWRAVQIGLTIDIVQVDGTRQRVSVPSWWEGAPWQERVRPEEVRLHENIRAGDGLKIKRIVLRYDETLDEPDIEGYEPQFWGIQLLRGQQWIETLHFGEVVPRERYKGLRGFVEFDSATERWLKEEAENPQHEKFNPRLSNVRALISVIQSKVQLFAEEQGWSQPIQTRPAPGAEQAVAYAIQRFFARGNRRRENEDRADTPNDQGPTQGELIQRDPEVRWECDLRFNLPDPSTARVDWGQSIRNVEADVRIEPPPGLGHDAIVSLEATHANRTGAPAVVAEIPVEVWGGAGTARFGDFQIIRGLPSAGRIQCPEPGQYRLRARVAANGGHVAKSSARSIYVDEDPPERSRRPYSLSISVANHSTGQRRINSGDTIGIQISVTNRSVNTEDLVLTASLGDLLLADDMRVSIPGTPAGATAQRNAAVSKRVVINPPTPNSAPGQLSVILSPGRHALNADLSLNGEFEAHASETLYIDIDPVRPQDGLPFDIRLMPSDGSPHPRWKFDKRDQDLWVLEYPEDYPLRRALESIGRRAGGRLGGIEAFIAEVCVEGIIEWAMEPSAGGDDSRLQEMLGDAPVDADGETWQKYCEKMEFLASRRREERPDMEKCDELARECAALMLSLFEGQEAS